MKYASIPNLAPEKSKKLSNPKRVQGEAKPEVEIVVSDISVKYRLLTEEQRTFKGRLLSSFRGQSTGAGEFWGLRDVSLHLRQGEVVGIIGPNGSGKSTLMKVMARVLDPTQGAVSVKGRVHPILELGGALNPYLTARENAYVYGSLFKQSRENVDQMIPEILEFSGLGRYFDVPMRSYSSGMSARLAFALATSIRPEILLLDEILAVGDEAFQQKSFARMRSLISSGSLVALVSHSMASIQEFCTRAVLIHQGEILEEGQPDQVIRSYRSLVRP